MNPTWCTRPLASAAATIWRPSATFIASGFSQRTCLPWDERTERLVVVKDVGGHDRHRIDIGARAELTKVRVDVRHLESVRQRARGGQSSAA